MINILIHKAYCYREIYFNDLVLLNCILNQFQPIDERLNKGAVLKNYVYMCFRNRYPEHLVFWRTADDKEVDFEIMYDDTRHAFEVKFSETQFAPSKCKVFNQLYPAIDLLIVS